jgi:hypothetical protein
VQLHDSAVPRLELDRSLMFPPFAVLWEQDWPRDCADDLLNRRRLALVQ